MNKVIESDLVDFQQQQNLISCQVHKNNHIQGVYVGETCPQQLKRLQCFKCVLKSKDLKCISMQNIFQCQKKNQTQGLQITLQESKESKLNEGKITQEQQCDDDFEEFESFWPPLKSELKEKINSIEKKLPNDIMEKITNTFDNITNNFINTLQQIKKETLLVAQQVLEDQYSLNEYYQEQKQLDVIKQILEKNIDDAEQTNKELEEFISNKYSISEEINKELTKKINLISQNLPQISDEVFQTFKKSLDKLLSSFRISQQKKSLSNIKFEKSTYEKSHLIKFEENEYGFQSMTAQFEGRGQIYSSLIFDPNLKYQFVFEFDRPPTECIILGLTEDDNKDLNWYDRNNFYAIQLGKSSNDSFCEKILKGKNIKQLFTYNSRLAMQVHIKENLLYFADHPDCENVNALDPKQYSFDPNTKYRIIIYFRNQQGTKINLISAHQINELLQFN